MPELVQVHESYFGEAEVRNGKTYLCCLVTPQFHSGPPRYWLILKLDPPIEGSMVVRTVRLARLKKDGFARPGKPTSVIDVSYDPDPTPPGVWRRRIEGEWTAKLVPIRRRSVWDRLRMA